MRRRAMKQPRDDPNPQTISPRTLDFPPMYFILQSTLQGEYAMSEHAIEDDIAFIRRTVADGRQFARGRSADLLVWGLVVPVGDIANYAHLRH